MYCSDYVDVIMERGLRCRNPRFMFDTIGATTMTVIAAATSNTGA
jgi:hypothetical protein